MKNKFQFAVILGFIYSSGLMAQEQNMSIGAPIGSPAGAVTIGETNSSVLPVAPTKASVTPAQPPASVSAVTRPAPPSNPGPAAIKPANAVPAPATPSGAPRPASAEKGALVVSGAPKKDEEEAKLKYFDPSKKLTIAEMSEMEREKLTNSFLSKYGYTTKEPVKLPKAEKPKAPPPMPDVVIIKGIYGSATKPYFDVSLNGKISKLNVGSTLKFSNTSLEIIGLSPKPGASILVEDMRHCKRKKCQEGKKKTIVAVVGEMIEFPK